MIDKIIKLEGVGILHESVPGDPLTLTKRVAIYADNGRGKSTFASLLRSLQDNDCAEVKARQSLRDVDGQRVELQIGETTHTYAEGAWDQTYDGLHVFDDYFVEANVSAGSIIWAAQLEHLFKLALRQARAHPSDDIEDTLADCVDGVNSRLRALRAEFDIATLVQVDAGETPRVDYTLRVMGYELPLVTADPASPSFSTVLGESDRRLLALAFFFYGLDSDPDLSGKTMVLDDPSRGLDRRHKTRVVDALLGFLERGQLIVLSADAEFVKMLRDRGFDQVLQLARPSIYCVFEECNIDTVLARDFVEDTTEPEGWQSGGHPWF